MKLTQESSLCYYTDAYILFKRTIIVTSGGADDGAKQLDERNKRVIFKNCT